ncbi:MAG: hypothetical protein AAGF89_14930 [Bacteroidota bacterium]
MTDEDKFRAQRQLNKARYAVEDFDDSVRELWKLGLLCLALALAMGVSLLFGAQNLEHLIISAITAVGVLLARRFNYLETAPLTGITAIYLLLIIGEWLKLGLPDLLLPFLNAEEWRGLPVFVNELSPYLYYLIKAGGLFFIIRIWFYRAAVKKQPDRLLKQLDHRRFVG